VQWRCDIDAFPASSVNNLDLLELLHYTSAGC
jgi:hypothetical protein